jgi:hypothetical protein
VLLYSASGEVNEEAGVWERCGFTVPAHARENKSSQFIELRPMEVLGFILWTAHIDFPTTIKRSGTTNEATIEIITTFSDF